MLPNLFVVAISQWCADSRYSLPFPHRLLAHSRTVEMQRQSVPVVIALLPLPAVPKSVLVCIYFFHWSVVAVVDHRSHHH